MFKIEEKRPTQHTNVLMLPIDIWRAEELARIVSEPAQPPGQLLTAEQYHSLTIELLLGIAAIENPEDRLLVAQAACLAVFQQTRSCEVALSDYVEEMHKTRR